MKVTISSFALFASLLFSATKTQADESSKYRITHYECTNTVVVGKPCDEKLHEEKFQCKKDIDSSCDIMCKSQGVDKQDASNPKWGRLLKKAKKPKKPKAEKEKNVEKKKGNKGDGNKGDVEDEYKFEEICGDPQDASSGGRWGRRLRSAV